jgi:8-oxo-dGTP pyrophosphatase MutT (NUDIX family)
VATRSFEKVIGPADQLEIVMLVNGDDPFNPALPAGIVDPGETSLQAGGRELKEETGLDFQKLVLIHSGAYVSPGGTSEKMALALAIVDTSKAGSGVFGKASEGESIKTEVISSREFIDRAERGDFYDMKTVTMAFWLAAHKKELRPAPLSRFFSQVSQKLKTALGINDKPRSNPTP